MKGNQTKPTKFFPRKILRNNTGKILFQKQTNPEKIENKQTKPTKFEKKTKTKLNKRNFFLQENQTSKFFVLKKPNQTKSAKFGKNI